MDLASEGAAATAATVDRAAVASWCASLGMGHLETSAKDGVGVQPAMTCVAMLALDERLKQVSHATILAVSAWADTP